MLKKTLKYIKICLLSISIFFSLYFIVAFVLSRLAVNEKEVTQADLSIYILTNGVHADIVVPIETEEINWRNWITQPVLIAQDTNYKYLAFGWGDKGFYLETPEWKDLKLSVAFKAAFGLSTSAMHTTFYKKMKLNDRCKEIKISIEQYKLLIANLKNGFCLNSNQVPIHIPTNAVYNSTDAFYEGMGSYSFFKTCNTWANNSLKNSNLKACIWTIFDTGIFLKY
jgi:uncharacterized protein (TIGR02117 family)